MLSFFPSRKHIEDDDAIDHVILGERCFTTYMYLAPLQRCRVLESVCSDVFKDTSLKVLFFFSRTDYIIPQTFTVTSEYIRFYLLVFLFYAF